MEGATAAGLVLEGGGAVVRKEGEAVALESLLAAAGGVDLLCFKMPVVCFFESGGECFFSSSMGFSANDTFLFSTTGCDWVLACESIDSSESERSRSDGCSFFEAGAAFGSGTSFAAAETDDREGCAESSSESRRGLSLPPFFVFAGTAATTGT